MAKKKIYAVRKGHKTGLFATWAECQKAVNGYSGAEFRGFTEKEEALAFLNMETTGNVSGDKAKEAAGVLVGIVFFLMVSFAAVTSSVSVMEAIVSSMMDKFHVSRKKGTILTTLYGMIVGVIVCLGYNKLYFELKLPNGAVAQILDVMDYISNNCLMPMVALLTCILIGWVVKPKVIIDEVTLGGYRFGREKLYVAMIKVIAPLMLLILLVQSVGL